MNQIADKSRERVMIGQEQIEEVRNFAYLESTLTNNGDVGFEVNGKIGKVSATFGQLQKI